MKRLTLFLAGASILAAQTPALINNPSAAERFAAPSEGLVAREGRYWKRTPIPVPENVVLEAGGILPIEGRRLLVTTRRGEIWLIEGAYDENPKPRYTLFASGLHEPLGIIPAEKGGYYVAQRQEMTRIADTDGDGRADVFETVARLPIAGSYHEYAFGPVLGPNGNLRITLNVAFGSATQAPSPWRGWMIEITPAGRIAPVAAGLRSPAGFLVTSKGAWFATDNQGEWVGSGKLTHIAPGDFLGHPAGLASSRAAGSTVDLVPEDIRDFEEPMHEVAKRIPALKPPAVWLPHTILGISNAGVIEDLSGGKFGPFAGQLFIGDQGQSKILRVSLEEVKGVWQGAAYPFREGFQSGILRLAQGEGGALFAGQTARGWGSVGPEQQGLERLEWTGEAPLEIQEIKAQPDGFELTFTRPVDRASAENEASYRVAGFTYLYHKAYGSAPINRMACPVRRVVVSPDGLRVRIAVACLREGYVHEIRVPGIKAAGSDESVLHDTAYYTLNRKPDGNRIVPLDTSEAELCLTVPAVAVMPSAKRPVTVPADWTNAEGDASVLLGTQPGLKFDTPVITVKAGSRLRLVFRNSDDMLHNFVLTAPGRGQAIGEAAMGLGIDGAAKSYVPDSPDVLVHSALIQPGESETLFFTVPSVPGDYDFLCTFPGHYQLMKGVLKVVP